MTLMICVLIFFVIVIPIIVVDCVKIAHKLDVAQEELKHCKSENIILKDEMENTNEEIKRLRGLHDTTSKVTVVRTERPLSTVTCCLEIPNELLYDKLDEYEIRRMEAAFMHRMYEAFKQSILPSADFIIEDDFQGFRKRLVCRVPVIVPLTPAIDMDKEHPIVDLILRLNREPDGRIL